MNTPWGQSDNHTVLADGIIFYSTPGHGGIWLSDERQKKIPPRVKNFLNDFTWWEEDCDWAVPYIVFKDDIQKFGAEEHFEKSLALAYDSVKNYHPEFSAPK